MSRTAEATLASALRLSVMRLARRLRAERADTALTLTQLATLSSLERHGQMTIGDLAAHEKVQPPSMTRVIGKLEQAGLVSRTPDPDDGRQVLVAVSEEARAMLRDDRRRRDAWLAQRMAELTPEELDLLRQAAPVLERLSAW